MSNQRVILLRDWSSHNEKAAYNRKVADSLVTQGVYPDWALTTLFYSAVHKVEAYLVRHAGYQGKTVTHQILLKEVAILDSRFKGIGQAYIFLHDEARSTRYDADYKVPDGFVTQALKSVESIAAQLDPMLIPPSPQP